MAFLDEVGLSELWNLIKAEDVDAIASAIAAAPKIETGSYTGANANKMIYFSGEPWVVIITVGVYSPAMNSSGFWKNDRGAILVRPATKGCITSSDNTTLVWGSDNSLNLRAASATDTMNSNQYTYHYIAFCK